MPYLTLLNCSLLDLPNFIHHSGSTFNTLFQLSCVLKTQGKRSNLILPPELAGYVDFSKSSLPCSGKRSVSTRKNIVALHYVGVNLPPAVLMMKAFHSFSEAKSFRPLFMINTFKDGVAGTVVIFRVDSPRTCVNLKYGIEFENLMYYPQVVTDNAHILSYLAWIALSSELEESVMRDPFFFHEGIDAVTAIAVDNPFTTLYSSFTIRDRILLYPGSNRLYPDCLSFFCKLYFPHIRVE
jgi:hypothetical protein